MAGKFGTGNFTMKKNILISWMLLFLLWVQAQQKTDIVNYIEKYKQAAIDEMARSKVPASITLAQGILESGAGKSELARNTNNHFGIKCKAEWNGEKYYYDDDAPQECFRVYKSVAESYADHSDFLLTRPRYAPLFQLPITSYKYWALGLKEAGYATNPKYASLLIGYIETYQLFQYDKAGVALIAENESRANQLAPVTAEIKQIEKPNATASEKTKVPHHTNTETDRVVVEREEYEVNGIRALIATAGEDPFKIAYEYHIDYSHIMTFNDMNTGDRFKKGQYIFLQAKRAKGSEANYRVKEGESMHDISQNTGVKLRELYTKNAMKMNDQPYLGEVLNLQEKRSAPPKTMSYAEYLKAQNKTTSSAITPTTLVVTE